VALREIHFLLKIFSDGSTVSHCGDWEGPRSSGRGGGSKRVEGDAKLIKSKQIVTMVLLLASVQQER